jgi:excisionase family DNA binding protein
LRDIIDMPTTQPHQSLANQMRFDVDRPAVDLSEPLLSAPQAAAVLSVRTSWVYDAARSGSLPCVRVGKHVRFLRSDLERWVAEQRHGR